MHKTVIRAGLLCCVVFLIAISYGTCGAGATDFARKQFQYEKIKKATAEDCGKSDSALLDRALAMVDRNQSQQGLKMAEGVYSSPGACAKAHGVYAWCLFRTGEWLKAIDAIDRAIETFGGDPQLVRIRVSMSMEMGELGTMRQSVDGNTKFSPKSMGLPFDEEQFKKGNLKSALNDLLYLSNSQPEGHEDTYLIAYLYFVFGDFKESNRFLEKLLSVQEYKNNALLGMTNNYIATKQYSLAEKILNEMETDYPKNPLVHRQLADLYTAMGNTTKAGDYQAKVEFYSSVPPLTNLVFNKENSELLGFFASPRNTAREKNKKLDAILKKGDREFAIDVCLTILANHLNPGNGLEESAVQGLIRFGKDSVPKTIQLLDLPNISTCAITNAAEILATVKDERGWQPLVDQLPKMARLSSLIFPPNVPGMMMKFDKDRSIKVLLPFIRDMIRADQAGDDTRDPGDSFERSMAYTWLCQSFASFNKSELMKLTKEHGYTERETQILLKHAYGK